MEPDRAGNGVLVRPNWLERALCVNRDPEWFYPVSQDHRSKEYIQHVRRAAAVCALCPVMDECFRYAQALGEQHGIWGGVDFGTNKAVRGVRTKRTLVVGKCR